jgi:hypothetical protein
LEIARSKVPDRVTVRALERNRLVMFSANLGGTLDKLMTINGEFRTLSTWCAGKMLLARGGGSCWFLSEQPLPLARLAVLKEPQT